MAKRTLDLICVLVGLGILFPCLLAVGLAVWILIGTPVLFRQKRPGLHGKPFLMLKFRTMTSARDAQGNLLSDVERLTSLAAGVRAFEEQLQRAWH